MGRSQIGIFAIDKSRISRAQYPPAELWVVTGGGANEASLHVEKGQAAGGVHVGDDPLAVLPLTLKSERRSTHEVIRSTRDIKSGIFDPSSIFA